MNRRKDNNLDDIFAGTVNQGQMFSHLPLFEKSLLKDFYKLLFLVNEADGKEKSINFYIEYYVMLEKHTMHSIIKRD